jgi:ATP-dependent Clp protease ATP-binding subunit ClpA
MEPPTVAEKIVSKDDTKTKEKKARTPAQIAAQQKALATLKEKRDKLKAEEDKAEKEAEVDASKKAELEKAKYEKAKTQRKRLPPAPSYITMNDLDKFKNDLLGSLTTNLNPKPHATAPVPKPYPVEIPAPIVVEKVIEKVIEKPVPVPQQKLTGHELLDRIFFNK